MPLLANEINFSASKVPGLASMVISAFGSNGSKLRMSDIN